MLFWVTFVIIINIKLGDTHGHFDLLHNGEVHISLQPWDTIVTYSAKKYGLMGARMRWLESMLGYLEDYKAD